MKKHDHGSCTGGFKRKTKERRNKIVKRKHSILKFANLNPCGCVSQFSAAKIANGGKMFEKLPLSCFSGNTDISGSYSKV